MNNKDTFQGLLNNTRYNPAIIGAACEIIEKFVAGNKNSEAREPQLRLYEALKLAVKNGECDNPEECWKLAHQTEV